MYLTWKMVVKRNIYILEIWSFHNSGDSYDTVYSYKWSWVFWRNMLCLCTSALKVTAVLYIPLKCQ
jgi:hypothetical protein